MKTVLLLGNLRWWTPQNNIFALFSARYTIKFTEKKWNKFINELWHINLYMNISISNWHNTNFDSTKIKFFNLFLFLTRLLTSEHFNLISTILVERIEVMWKTCFSASQNANNESQLIHKNHVRNRVFIDRSSRRIILVITWWAHKRQTFTLISIYLKWILKFFVYT